MMEVMVVVAIVAILATLALPSYLAKLITDQIVAALPLADVAKAPIALSWAATQTLPVDNAAAGLPAPDKIVDNYVRSVTVENGAIQITFGNSAHTGSPARCFRCGRPWWRTRRSCRSRGSAVTRTCRTR